MAAGRKSSSREFSVELSNVLDVIGYSKEQIKNGQRWARNIQDHVNPTNNYKNNKVFLVGSKKEGMSFQELDSDIDYMCIFDKVMCFQSDAVEDRSRSLGTSFVLDFQGVPPGYAMLEIEELSPDFIEGVCVYSIDSNKTYLSSKRLNSELSTLVESELGYEQSEETGPVPRKQAKSQLQKYTVTCECMDTMKQHSTKKRLNDVHEASSSENDPGQFRPNVSAVLDKEACFGRNYVEVENRNYFQDEHDRVETNTETGHQIEAIGTQSNSTVYFKHELSINQTGPSQVVQFGQPFDEFVSQVTDHPTISSQIPASELNKNVSRQKPDGSSLWEVMISSRSFTQNGPSLVEQLGQPFDKLVSKDNVIGFPAQCENLKKLWRSRTRYNGFPSTNQIEKISKMDAHVVPVGCKKSEGADLQWRICFTFGEIELVQSLNGTQYHLYALLRFFAKDVIKPICPGVITSYVMRNVVLWMAELKSMSYFTEDRLEQCLIESVHFLYMCLTNAFMPNYMIASRNLFQNRLSPKKEVKLRTLLKTLVSEGGSMVLRCDKIRLNMMSSYTKDIYGMTESRRRMHSEMFENPGVKQFFNAMDSVFALVISSIERSFADKPLVVKGINTFVLSNVNKWIINLPVVSPERIPVRSRLRQQCLDLRKRISVSCVREFLCNSICLPILEAFVNVMVEWFMKSVDYFGVVDESKMAELMTNPMKLIQLIFGKRRSPSTTQKSKECVDIDLD